MAWTSPATPVPGTAITVAFYGTNIKDNLNWLRQNTGGGFDPTGAGQVLRSTGIAATEWTSSPTIPGNVIISGTLSVTGTSAHTGAGTFSAGLTVNGGNLSMGSSNRKVMFAAEVGDKIDFTSAGTVLCGVATSTLYWRADGNYSWRDETGVERMKLTTGATPVLTVGGNGVYHAGNDSALAKLASANFTALQMGGITVARPATNTYTGDGGTGGRQITVGFVPKLVHLWAQTSGSTMYIIMHDGGCIRLHNGGNPEYTTEVKLHATDGFIVGPGVNHRGNDVSETYRWVAMI